MKKIFALILTAALAITAVGCRKSDDSESRRTNRLEEIKERGVLTVATEPYFAPNEFIDPTKTGDEMYVGSDIEFAKYIGEKLGVEVKIVPLEFTEVLTSVQQGKYDIAISALSYTADRAEGMNLSKSYYKSEDSKGYGMVVRKSDADKYTTAESYADATLIVQKGSMQETFIKEQIPSYKELKYLASMTDTFLAVSEGKADRAACSIDMAELFIRANPDLDLAVVQDFKFTIDPEKDGVLVAMAKGEDELTDRINDIIDEFRETGLYKQWNDEYKAYAKKLGIE